MERNNSKSWNNKFIIALANKDTEAITSLQANMPKFVLKEDIKEALGLISEAISFYKQEKQKLSISMKQIERSREFVQANIKRHSKSSFDSLF